MIKVVNNRPGGGDLKTKWKTDGIVNILFSVDLYEHIDV